MPRRPEQDPAFPIAQDAAEVVDQGLTKLEYMASAAQCAMLSSPSGMQAAVTHAAAHKVSPTYWLARCAVDHARALLEALGEASDGRG